MSRQGNFRKPTYENIQKFWDAEASEIGETPQVTIRDVYFRIHELHTLLPLIPSNSRLLDIGCGTGFGTFILAKRPKFTLGVDYSSEMIKWANNLKDNTRFRERLSADLCPLWDMPAISSDTEFSEGNILELNIEKTAFDVITGQRILINLPSHEDQLRALSNLRKYSTNEALLLFTEATLQGHQKTDEYRKRFGLPEMEKYWHNNYVDESKFDDWKDVGWEVKGSIGFDSYMLLSKVIYPAAIGQKNCAFLSGANAAAMEVASVFRSKAAVEEIGVERFFEMYLERVRLYEPDVGEAISKWLNKHEDELPDWAQLGHQKLILAKAI